MSSPTMMAPLVVNKDRGASAVAFFWVLSLVSILVTFGRFYVRSTIRAIGADGW